MPEKNHPSQKYNQIDAKKDNLMNPQFLSGSSIYKKSFQKLWVF